MIAKSEFLTPDPFLDALKRASVDARRVAYATKTPLVIVKDGKIVRAKVLKSLELRFPKKEDK